MIIFGRFPASWVFKYIFSRLLEAFWNVAHHFRLISQNLFLCIIFIVPFSAITGDFVLHLFLSINGYFVLSSLVWFWSAKHFCFYMRAVVPFPFRPVISIRLWLLFLYQSDINKVFLARFSPSLYIEIISFYNNADDGRPNFRMPPLKKPRDNGQCQNKGHIWGFVLFSAPYQYDGRIAKTVSSIYTVQSAHANVSSWMVG